MAAKGASEIPVGMRRVCRRFERWRKGHKARFPFPEALWAEAAEAAREHGVFRASKALRLEYGKLKQMVEAGPRQSGRRWRQQHFGNWRRPRPAVSPSG